MTSSISSYQCPHTKCPFTWNTTSYLSVPYCLVKGKMSTWTSSWSAAPVNVSAALQCICLPHRKHRPQAQRRHPRGETVAHNSRQEEAGGQENPSISYPSTVQPVAVPSGTRWRKNRRRRRRRKRHASWQGCAVGRRGGRQRRSRRVRQGQPFLARKIQSAWGGETEE